jgi:hypothetical protein
MESLVFTCPHTRAMIDSGISTNPESLSAVQDLRVELNCPHCRSRHRFPVKQGQFRESLAAIGEEVFARRQSPRGMSAHDVI